MKTVIDETVPPLISQISEVLYRVSHGCESYTIAFLPGRIALCGTPGHQFFLNSGNLPPWKLREILRDRESYIDQAILHKETTTDPAKFIASIESLHLQKVIDAHSRRNLREFILKCDCPPRRIKDKLKAMGYGHILAKLEFERYPDELLTTIEAMEKFVENTPSEVEVTEKQPRRSRSRAEVRPELKRGAAHRS